MTGPKSSGVVEVGQQPLMGGLWWIAECREHEVIHFFE